MSKRLVLLLSSVTLCAGSLLAALCENESPFDRFEKKIKKECKVVPSFPTIEIKDKEGNVFIPVDVRISPPSYYEGKISDFGDYTIRLTDSSDKKCIELLRDRSEGQTYIEYLNDDDKEIVECTRGYISGHRLPKHSRYIQKKLDEITKFHSRFEKTKISKNQTIYYDISFPDPPSVIWRDGGFEYRMSFVNATKEDLIKLAKSALTKKTKKYS